MHGHTIIKFVVTCRGVTNIFFVCFTCVIFNAEVYYIGKTLSRGESCEVALHLYTSKCCTNEFISYFCQHSCPVALCVVSIPVFVLRSLLFFLYFSAFFSFLSLVLEQVYYRFTCHLFCQIYFPFAVHHHNHHPISTDILALSGLLTTSILSQLLALLKQLREQDIV